MDTNVKPASDAVAVVDTDAVTLRDSISRHLIYTVGKDALAASKRDWLFALSTAMSALVPKVAVAFYLLISLMLIGHPFWGLPRRAWAKRRRSAPVGDDVE